MTDMSIPSISVTPGMLPDEEMFWCWRQSILPYFESVPLADPARPPVIPEFHLFNAGDFLFFDTKFSRQRFLRDATWLRRNDDVEHFAIQYYRLGRNDVDNGQTNYTALAGGTYIVNLAYETDACSADNEVLSVILPRQVLDAHIPQLVRARGTLFAPGTMAGRLFGDFMESMGRNMRRAGRDDVPLMADALFGMLSVLHAGGDPGSRDVRQGTLNAVRRHIDARLSDPNLGVASLCAHFRMSRATLYRLFEAQGGVRDYIQRRRLMGAFRKLTLPGNAARGVFDVAMDVGFTSASHFASRFRAEFGMTPSEVRDAAAALHGRGDVLADEGVAEGLPDAEVITRWIRRLGG